jgi:hypothetical protein
MVETLSGAEIPSAVPCGRRVRNSTTLLGRMQRIMPVVDSSLIIWARGAFGVLLGGLLLRRCPHWVNAKLAGLNFCFSSKFETFQRLTINSFRDEAERGKRDGDGEVGCRRSRKCKCFQQTGTSNFGWQADPLANKPGLRVFRNT